MSLSCHNKITHALFAFFLCASQTASLAQVSSEKPKTTHVRPTIRQFAENNNVSIGLYGDGSATSHADLSLTCKETGQTTSTEIETICISTKTKKPPPTREVAEQEHISYKLGGPAPAALVNIVNSANYLAKLGKFDKVPFASERKRHTVAQLAIWKHMSDSKEATAKDKITNASIENDLLRQAKLSRKDLPPAAKQAIERNILELISAVDLTLKQSETIPEEKKSEDKETMFTGQVTDESQHEHVGTNEEHLKHDALYSGNEPSTGEREHPKSALEYPHDEVVIPQFTVFECSDSHYQDMLCCQTAFICSPCPLPALPSQLPSPAPNVLPQQPAPGQSIIDCCIDNVTVTNDFNQPVVYQLSNDAVPINSPGVAFPKILAESNFIQPGASTQLGQIRQKCVYIVAYVPGSTSMYKYCCDGVGRKTITTNLPGLKSITVESIECASSVPIITTPRTTPAPTSPSTTPGGAAPNTPSTTPPTTPPTNPPTTPPATPPSTGTPSGPASTAGTGGGTPGGRAGAPGSPGGGSGGNPPPPIMPPPMNPPKGKPDKGNPKNKDNSCNIKSFVFTNDYKLPVRYSIYKRPTTGEARQILKSSEKVLPGKSVTLQGDFGKSVRVAAVKLETRDGTEIVTSLSIQEFSCHQQGQELSVSDYEAFKKVTMTAGN